jgi:hypothetical protein
VKANPNNVLSAIATVSWQGPVTSVTITYGGTSTPSFDLSTATSPANEPVLGLAPQTQYTLRAVGQAGGSFVSSNEVTFTTGALPSDLPPFTATGTQSGPGYNLISRVQQGPHGGDYVQILDSTGAPVWYYRLPQGNLQADFQQQPDNTYTLAVPAPAGQTIPLSGLSAQYLQIDVLGNIIHTWTALGPDGSGNIASDTNGNPLTVDATDLHDIRIQPNGDAIFFGYILQTINLQAIGGLANAQVYASILERVGPDGTVKFAWNSLEYFSPTDVDTQVASVRNANVDMIHANSIDVTADGNYLLSLRNLSAVVKIDKTTGKKLWTLGGAGISVPSSGGPMGDFTFVNDPIVNACTNNSCMWGGFSAQHGARELPNGDILIFDDGNGHVPQQSRAVEYKLDLTHMTATYVWGTPPSTSLFTPLMGYSQRLSNGNTIVDFGEASVVQEWTSLATATAPVWTLSDASNAAFAFYRAYRIGSLYTYSPQ